MSKREAIEKGYNSKKRAPNFKHDEIMILLHEIQKSLFGMLSPSLTFHMKTKAWLAVREQLVVAGYPPRTKEQLKKKWEDSATATKAKYARKRKTGGGAINWNIIDELVTDILGKDNPSLTSIGSIPGGIDSAWDKRMDRPQITIDNSDEDDREWHSTSSYRLRSSTAPVPSNIDPTSNDIAEVTDLQCEGDGIDYHSDADDVNVRKHQSSARSETARDTKMFLESVYEQHLIQEHEIKMRISMKKKEELIDLKLGYYWQKIAREFHK